MAAHSLTWSIAEAVGLCTEPLCLVRVKRLEKAGYILGYGAQIQMQKLGDTPDRSHRGGTHEIIEVQDHSRFEAAIRKVDQIIGVRAIW